jgi:sulfur-oxidizing protein SoxY
MAKLSNRLRQRRALLVGGMSAAAAILATPAQAFQWRNKVSLFRRAFPVQPDRAEAELMITAILDGRTPRPGLVQIEAPGLVENGESVPLKIFVDCAMTDKDHPQLIHVFALDNPFPEVARYHLLPAGGEARLEMRCRMARSSELVVVAEMTDGTTGLDQRHVDVTLGACG